MLFFRKKNIFLIGFVFLICAPLQGATIKQGVALLRQGQRKSARYIFKSIYRSARNQRLRASAYFYLIVTSQDVNYQKSAYERFMRLYAAHPFYVKACHSLAILYTVSGQYAQAILLFRILQDYPAYAADAFFRLGQIAIKQHNYARAVRYFTTILNKSSMRDIHARAFFYRGAARFRLGHNRSAQRDMLTILTRYAKSSQAAGALYLLGLQADKERQHRLALDYYRKLGIRFPRSFYYYLARGRLRVLRSKFVITKKIRVYEVQLAVYYKKKHAVRFISKLKKKGFAPFIYKNKIKSKIMYSVRLGYYRTRAIAKKMLARVNKRALGGFIRTRLVVVSEDNLDR